MRGTEHSERGFQSGRQQNKLQVDQVNGSWSEEAFLPQGRVEEGECWRWSGWSGARVVQRRLASLPANAAVVKRKRFVLE